MKIIFLDIDGVLNCAEYFHTRQTPRDMKPRDMDVFRVVLLHRIIQATGAKVVVSSSWRLSTESLDEIKTMLGEHYLDVTPRHARHEDRHEEIRAWLDTHAEIDRYAILDDDFCAGVDHGDNFFKTEWYGGGLTDEISGRVIAHLNSATIDPSRPRD